jgi:large subunit ribosomal protein L9
MAKTEVILIGSVPDLGAESDQVSVAAGYARNYLIPQGLAIPLTAANKRRLQALRKRREKREIEEVKSMTDLAKSLSKLVLMLTVKTGDEGKMFGSVTVSTILRELKHQFDVNLEKKHIDLDEPIKSLGDHEIKLKLHPEIEAVLKLRIKSNTPPPSTQAEEEKAPEEQAQ